MSKHLSGHPKDIFYVYATKENKKFIDYLHAEISQSRSYIINRIIEGYRENIPVKFQKRTPKFVERAEKWRLAKAKRKANRKSATATPVTDSGENSGT